MDAIDNLEQILEAEHFRVVWVNSEGWHCWNTYGASTVRADITVLRSEGVHQVWVFPASFSRHHAIKAAKKDKIGELAQQAG